MEPCDAVKLIYQNEFGGGHLVVDQEQSLLRLAAEYDAISQTDDMPLLEEIGNGLVRVMLPALGRGGYSPEQLNRDFVRSSQLHTGKLESFLMKLSCLSALTREGCFSFSTKELDAYLVSYRKAGCPPVSHSHAYRAAYSPAYRVVRRECLSPALAAETPAEAVWRSALAHLAQHDRAIVAIDGRCAAGKSSLAETLRVRYGCCVVHMDHFFLRPEQRTPQRYETPGENIDHERFLQEVLVPLRRGQLPSYRPFDCHTQQLIDPVQLPDRPVIVVEGSYSCHPSLRDQYDLRVFLSVDPDLQLERIRRRDGDEYAQVFQTKWIPLEERYLSHCKVEDCCQLKFLSE